MDSEILLDRLTTASIQLGIGVVFVWLLCVTVRSLPGGVRAWLWRLVGLKGLVAMAIVLPLALLKPEPLDANLHLIPVPPNMPQSAMVNFPASPPAPEPISFATVAGVVWLLGLAIWILWTAVVVARTERFVWRMRRLDNLGRHEFVLRSAAVETPMVAGLLRPTVFLPDHPDSDLALVHEEAHIRRRDLFWDLAARVFLGVFWFHPLAWLAFREHRQCCEEACDEIALKTSSVSRDRYCQALLTFSVAVGPRMNALSSASSDLRRRIYHMTRSHLRLSTALLILVPASLLLIPATLVARQQTGTSAEREPRYPTQQYVAHWEDPLADQVVDVAAFQILPFSAKELRMTPEQRKRIADVSQKLSSDTRAIEERAATMRGKGLGPEYRAKFENLQKRMLYYSTAELALTALDRGQAHRARQLAIGNIGIISFAQPAIASAAGISEEKRKEIARIRNERTQAEQRIKAQARTEFEPFVNDMSRLLPESDRIRYEKYRTRHDELNKNELAEFSALQRRAFTVLFSRIDAREKALRAESYQREQFTERLQRASSPELLAAFKKLTED